MMNVEQREKGSMSESELQGVYTNAVDEIQRRLGERALTAPEKIAVAWLVGTQAPLQTELLQVNASEQVDTLFGTNPADKAKETAWKIRLSVSRLTEPEIIKREQAGEDVAVFKMIQRADHNQASDTYSKGGIPSLGSVPKEWVPASLQPTIQAAMLE